MISVSRAGSRLRGRNCRGDGLVAGVIGLCMIIIGTLAATVFLTDVGMSLYYKQKLGFATSQTASFAACLERGHDDKIVEFARTVLGKFSNGPSQCKVKHEIITVDGKVLSQVTLEDDLPLFVSQFSFLPLKVHLQDTAVAIRFFDVWRDLQREVSGSGGSLNSARSLVTAPQQIPDDMRRQRIFGLPGGGTNGRVLAIPVQFEEVRRQLERMQQTPGR